MAETQTQERSREEIRELLRRGLWKVDKYRVSLMWGITTYIHAGMISEEGIVDIEYTGYPYQAFVCDELRKYCDKNKIRYREPIADPLVLAHLKRSAQTLTQIVQRLEPQGR